ncbi:hypothetical protein LR48_Vigan02g242100 [Vigna angularis]|uniref:Uncharacterized protein n=1 Tax=Phaseolus angularis TaxID=3914 RepID=A0A0L9U0I2_PHAAN|nr:hypothetical protein LR48_Vigan02g242100 [Vigna angularis]
MYVSIVKQVLIKTYLPRQQNPKHHEQQDSLSTMKERDQPHNESFNAQKERHPQHHTPFQP